MTGNFAWTKTPLPELTASADLLIKSLSVQFPWPSVLILILPSNGRIGKVPLVRDDALMAMSFPLRSSWGSRSCALRARESTQEGPAPAVGRRSSAPAALHSRYGFVGRKHAVGEVAEIGYR